MIFYVFDFLLKYILLHVIFGEKQKTDIFTKTDFQQPWTLINFCVANCCFVLPNIRLIYMSDDVLCCNLS